jgi:tetratricopeptide (TPR) repeat protein
MYDLNEEEETPYITMEYVKGEDLKSFIRRKETLKKEEVIALAKQVCEGLAEAHELGVVHRDLKPQNIMIDEKSNAKIMDFGIARSVEAPGVTQTGLMIGTPDYISPEQAEGKEADQRSDIYALGVILYEMVTGSVPFKGDTALSVALKHKSKLPSDPKKLNPDISDELSRLILICMEKERERRYQTAETLLADLRNIEEGLPLGTKLRPRGETFATVLIRKKLFIPALVVAFAIIAVVIWQILPQKEAIVIPSDKPSLAVMYFKNNTGDENLDHWRSALSQWLITDLTQSKYIDVLPEDRLFSISRKLKLLEAKSYATEDLRKIAAESRVKHIFQASLSKAGEMFRIDYSLQEAETLKPISSDYVSGKGEDSFPVLVDKLTRKIKVHLKLSDREMAKDIDKEVGKITTCIPEAYKYYSEGRKYHQRADYSQSISFMEKAIELDPEFAMAYRSMAASYNNMKEKNKEEIEKNFKKALELSDRVSERERYLIQGGYYKTVEKNYEKAIEAYTKLLELYPDDYAGNHNLGNLYNIIDDRDKAVKYFELAYLKNKTSYIGSYNLARNYYWIGLIDKAIEVWEYYTTNAPDDIKGHLRLHPLYVGVAKYDLAFEEAEKIHKLNPKRRYLDLIYYLQGDFSAAEEEYKWWFGTDREEGQLSEARVGLTILYRTQGQFKKAKEQALLGLKQTEEASDKEDKFWKGAFHDQLAYIYLQTGNPEEALEEAERQWKIGVEYKHVGVQTYALDAKIAIYLNIGLLEEAQKVAGELKEVIEKSSTRKSVIQRRMSRHYAVIGKIEIEKGNFEKAIVNLKEALSRDNPNPLYKDARCHESLALAYYKTGDLEEARENYEKITLLTYGRAENGEIYAKSFYMLGKTYEQQGQKAKAIEHYEKFFDLWKDADPGIAEVEDAKKRLAGLKESR